MKKIIICIVLILLTKLVFSDTSTDEYINIEDEILEEIILEKDKNDILSSDDSLPVKENEIASAENDKSEDDKLDQDIENIYNELKNEVLKQEVKELVRQKNYNKFYFPNYIGFYSSAGYFVPMSKWWEIITGVINVETGIRVVRLPAFVDKEKFDLVIRPGFSVSYSFGINKPVYNNFYLNSVTFRFPVELCFDFLNAFSFNFGSGCLVELDIFSRQKNDSDEYDHYISSAFGVFASLAFEYYFGNRMLIGIGTNNIFDFKFYSDVSIDYKCQLYLVWKFKER